MIYNDSNITNNDKDKGWLSNDNKVINSDNR